MADNAEKEIQPTEEHKAEGNDRQANKDLPKQLLASTQSESIIQGAEQDNRNRSDRERYRFIKSFLKKTGVLFCPNQKNRHRNKQTKQNGSTTAKSYRFAVKLTMAVRVIHHSYSQGKQPCQGCNDQRTQKRNSDSNKWVNHR
jgi:hypothetical protein